MAIEEESGGGDIPEWVVTFGDMMSLLLTFFIMLVSLSEVKQEERFAAMVESMRQQFGHDLTRASVLPGKARPRNSALAKLATMGRARKMDIMAGGSKARAPQGENPNQKVSRPGKTTRTATTLIYPEGIATLTDAHKAQLRIFAQEIVGKPQKIEIRGHTTMKPATAKSADFQDNWSLAFARTQQVLDYFVRELNIDPIRFRVSQAASNEPVYRSETAEGDKPLFNPRVEVFMLDENFEDLRGTLEERQQRFDEPAEATSGDAEQPASD